MQKSNWRKEIGILNEFVGGDDPTPWWLKALGGALGTAKKVKDVLPKLNPGKVRKLVPFPPGGNPNKNDTIIKPNVDPEVDGKGFKPTPYNPKGFEPSDEIKKEKERILKQRRIKDAGEFTTTPVKPKPDTKPKPEIEPQPDTTKPKKPFEIPVFPDKPKPDPKPEPKPDRPVPPKPDTAPEPKKPPLPAPVPPKKPAKPVPTPL